MFMPYEKCTRNYLPTLSTMFALLRCTILNVILDSAYFLVTTHHLQFFIETVVNDTLLYYKYAIDSLHFEGLNLLLSRRK